MSYTWVINTGFGALSPELGRDYEHQFKGDGFNVDAICRRKQRVFHFNHENTLTILTATLPLIYMVFARVFPP